MPRALLIKKPKYEVDEPSEPSSELGDDDDENVVEKQNGNKKAGCSKKKCKHSKDDIQDAGCIVGKHQNNLHYLKWVLKNNTPVKVWECGMCNKEFNHQYTLARHIPVHTGERNYICNECGKSFRQASTLCRHKAIHSEARPFQCLSCGKAFNRSSTLIAHSKTHSELKPHICPICGKGFHQKGNLKNHIFTHTNERPYQCDMCEKSFNQMSNLVCHKAHAHSLRVKHQCHLCGKYFPRKYNLRKHEEYLHGIKYGTGNNLENTNDLPVVKGRPLNSTPSKTITLPNGDKTIQFLPKTQNFQKTNNSVPTSNKTKEISPAGTITADFVQNNETVVNNSEFGSNSNTINSSVKALGNNATVGKRTIILNSNSPHNNSNLALLKPTNGNLLLVKFVTANGRQTLIPASAVDIQYIVKSNQSESVSSAVQTIPLKIPVINCTSFANIGNLKLNPTQNKDSNLSNIKIVHMTNKLTTANNFSESAKDNVSINLKKLTDSLEDKNFETLKPVMDAKVKLSNDCSGKTKSLDMLSSDFQENEDIATLMKNIKALNDSIN